MKNLFLLVGSVLLLASCANNNATIKASSDPVCKTVDCSLIAFTYKTEDERGIRARLYSKCCHKSPMLMIKD